MAQAASLFRLLGDDVRLRILRLGLTDVRVGVGSHRTGGPFTVIVASGRKPASGITHTKKRAGER